MTRRRWQTVSWRAKTISLTCRRSLWAAALCLAACYVMSGSAYASAADASDLSGHPAMTLPPPPLPEYDTPELLWSYSTGNTIESTPVVVNGILYVGSVDHHLYALDAASGELAWRYKTGNVVWSSPTVADGIVYIGSDDRHLHAVDAASGEPLWTFKPGALEESSATAIHYIRLRPAVAGGHVYFTLKGSLYALDAVSGELRWHAAPGTYAGSPPAAADGIVYVGGGEDNVHALDWASGEEIWRFATNGMVFEKPTVANGVVYVTTSGDDGRLYALDAASGEQLWSSGISGIGGWDAVISGGGVYVSGSYGVFALDAASGELLPNFPVPFGAKAALTVADGVIYAGNFLRAGCRQRRGFVAIRHT